MARLPRLIVGGFPHLIRQQVQQHQTLAIDSTDCTALIDRLQRSAQTQRVQIHAYGVRSDRFELVVTPPDAFALSRFMQSVARGHAAEFNQKHGRSGSLWSGRFRIAVLDPGAWLLPCMTYVEQRLQALLPSENSEPEACEAASATSAAHHSGACVVTWLNDPPVYWSLGNTPFERHEAYRALLQQTMSPDRVARIEQALRGGWALGDEQFLQRIAGLSGRATQPKPPGRPARVRA